MVEADTLEQLKRDAQNGRGVQARQQAEQRAQLVRAAVLDGRIPPARRAHWASVLEADPEMGKLLAAMPTGVVPVGPAIGHNPEADSRGADLGWFDAARPAGA